MAHRFAFFGTHPLADAVLNELEKAGFVPSLIVAGQDSLDRKKNVVFPPEKAWAEARGIPIIQPRKIDANVCDELRAGNFDFFIVASYGKILPNALLEIPPRGSINLHPSLLPKLRGPSPIRTAILNDEKETGVSIMLIDAELDHGPLIAQEKVEVSEWPMRGRDLDALLAQKGAELLVRVLPDYLSDRITLQDQNHAEATFTKIFEKENGHINLKDDAYTNLLKIRAFDGWPGAFTFFERAGVTVRVAILDAHIEGKKLIIDSVKPEGKGEMTYADFARSGAEPID